MTERLTLREEIEREPIASAFKEGMGLMSQVITELKDKAVRYKLERDELLLHTKRLLLTHGCTLGDPDHCADCRDVRAAIAKAEGR